MLWAVLSVLAALCWAVSNIIDKYVLTKLVKNPYISVIAVGVFGIAASILIYAFRGYSELSQVNLFLSFAAAIAYILGNVFYFKATKIDEISKISALGYLTPFFVAMLAAVFLDEIFAPIKYFGMFLVVAGAALISLESSESIAKIRFGKGVWLMVLSGISIAINVVITKHLLYFADFWTVFSYTRGIGLLPALIPIALFNFRDLSDFSARAKQSGNMGVGFISLSAIFNIGGGVLITSATAIGSATLVNALSSSRPFFVLIFALILSVFYPNILKEKIGKSEIILKIAAIILMFVGAVLIS